MKSKEIIRFQWDSTFPVMKSQTKNTCLLFRMNKWRVSDSRSGRCVFQGAKKWWLISKMGHDIFSMLQKQKILSLWSWQTYYQWVSVFHAPGWDHADHWPGVENQGLCSKWARKKREGGSLGMMWTRKVPEGNQEIKNHLYLPVRMSCIWKCSPMTHPLQRNTDWTNRKFPKANEGINPYVIIMLCSSSLRSFICRSWKVLQTLIKCYTIPLKWVLLCPFSRWENW